MHDAPRILFFCKGNLCRSPLAAALLERAVPGTKATSAGLLDLGSASPPPETLVVASELGVDLSNHRSRYIATVDLHSFDLLLAFERSQVAEAVVEYSAPAHRTFQLTEFVRLAGDGPVRSLSELVADAAQSRRRASFVPDDDIQDPIGRPEQVHRRTAAQVAAAVRDLCSVLPEEPNRDLTKRYR